MAKKMLLAAKTLLIVIIISVLAIVILFDLTFFAPGSESRYSVIKNIICNLSPDKDYKPIRVPRKTDDLGGYYCVTQEQYDNDIAG